LVQRVTPVGQKPQNRHELSKYRGICTAHILLVIINLVIIGSRPSDHYFCIVCPSVCLSVCLCRVFLSRLRSDLDQTRTHVTCPDL